MSQNDNQITATNLRQLSDFMLELGRGEHGHKVIKQSTYFSDVQGADVSEAAYEMTEGEVRKSEWCGTCACTLGFASCILPPVASDLEELLDGYYFFDIEKYGARVFPSLYDPGVGPGLWVKVFDANLSDSFIDSAARCEALAEELEAAA